MMVQTSARFHREAENRLFTRNARRPQALTQHSRILVRLVLQIVASSLLPIALSGCSVLPYGAYTNKSIKEVSSDSDFWPIPSSTDLPKDTSRRATLAITPNRGDKDTLFMLALSGGGSRAANWAASSMFKLQDYQFRLSQNSSDLLSQVDVISSVSGGSLPAAYYGISTDPVDPEVTGRTWDRETVSKLLRKNYVTRWLGNWFWPSNVARYWLTPFDRTDIMAQTLADNLFDAKTKDDNYGRDFRLKDLNPSRPYLILNATNASRNKKIEDDQTKTMKAGFAEPFTFTHEDFAAIGSDIDEYSVARAVMGTATFPGAFNTMTLRDYSVDDQRKPAYIHLFDGGNADNLGVGGLSRALQLANEAHISYKNLIVVVIDAYVDHSGISTSRADPRTPSDYIIDSNFLDATDALLSRNRKALLKGLTKDLESIPIPREHKILYHLQFNDLARLHVKRGTPQARQLTRLIARLNRIPTDFSISDEDADAVEKAADMLLSADNECLSRIADLISGKNIDARLPDDQTPVSIKCRWPR